MTISTYCSNHHCLDAQTCQRSYTQVEELRPTYFLSRMIIQKMGFDCYMPFEEDGAVPAQGDGT